MDHFKGSNMFKATQPGQIKMNTTKIFLILYKWKTFTYATPTTNLNYRPGCDYTSAVSPPNLTKELPHQKSMSLQERAHYTADFENRSVLLLVRGQMTLGTN